MPDDDEVFVRALVSRVPSLKPILDQHLADYDELLSHVFFGDISRWAVTASRSATPVADLDILIEVLEEARHAGDANTCELIDASFVENICGEPDLAGQLPPVLNGRYRTICGQGLI